LTLENLNPPWGPSVASSTPVPSAEEEGRTGHLLSPSPVPSCHRRLQRRRTQSPRSDTNGARTRPRDAVTRRTRSLPPCPTAAPASSALPNFSPLLLRPAVPTGRPARGEEDVVSAPCPGRRASRERSRGAQASSGMSPGRPGGAVAP